MVLADTDLDTYQAREAHSVSRGHHKEVNALVRAWAGAHDVPVVKNKGELVTIKAQDLAGLGITELTQAYLILGAEQVVGDPQVAYRKLWVGDRLKEAAYHNLPLGADARMEMTDADWAEVITEVQDYTKDPLGWALKDTTNAERVPYGMLEALEVHHRNKTPEEVEDTSSEDDKFRWLLHNGAVIDVEAYAEVLKHTGENTRALLKRTDLAQKTLDALDLIDAES